MILEIQVLNSDATLNAFFDLEVAQFSPGVGFTLMIRLRQPERDLIRYVADAGATLAGDFKNSDGTTLNKAFTNPFADDRSIWSAAFSDAESAELIGQDLKLTLTEGSDKLVAIKAMGLQAVKTGTC